MGRRGAWARCLVFAVTLAACSASAPASQQPASLVAPGTTTAQRPGPTGTISPGAVTPTAFTITYFTGSIPPPYNHMYTLDGTFEDGQLAIRYALTYRYREGMTAAELASRGYSDHDDIEWSGRLTGAAVEQWRTLLRAARLGAPPTPLLGSDSFAMTIRNSSGATQNGVPADRTPWLAVIAAIDQQARLETRNPRPQP
jgi:hypothetical protein